MYSRFMHKITTLPDKTNTSYNRYYPQQSLYKHDDITWKYIREKIRQIILREKEYTPLNRKLATKDY